MRTIRKVSIIVSLLFAAGMITAQNVSGQENQSKLWEVPEEYKNMENPVAKGEESNKIGKALYDRQCASCHGKTGLSDGFKSRTLSDFAGDFSGDYYQNQTDGEHFYKTKFGREEMPKYDGILTDEQIWNIVNYMRTFKKE
jgi:mono/diheme cytochrome c family protein